MPSKDAPPVPRTAGDMVRMAREFLERRGVEAARLEAELLVAHALGLDRLKLFLQLDRPVTGAEGSFAGKLDAMFDALEAVDREERIASL